jgi:hypothetical protein
MPDFANDRIPNLSRQFWTTPTYILANSSASGETAITFRLIVRDAGTAASQAINDTVAIWFQDTANPAWAGAPCGETPGPARCVDGCCTPAC